jgi:hypothetical protein
MLIPEFWENFIVLYKFHAFPITNMWQVYMRTANASDFFEKT